MTFPALAPDGSRRLTLSEWAAMAPNVRGELVDGLLVEEEMADFVHDFVVGWLITMVGSWILPRGGFVASSDARFGVDDAHGRKPDATVYFPGAAKPPARGLVRVPPSIAIEVVSPTPRDARRDRIEKLREYAQFGVHHYWIVDPQLRSFEVLELGSDHRYVHVVAATEGTFGIPGCDGLVLDLEDLWQRVDALDDE